MLPRAKVTIDSLEVVYEIGWCQNELFRGRIKVTSISALHLTLNISETVRERLGSKGPPIGNGIWTIEWSRGR